MSESKSKSEPEARFILENQATRETTPVDVRVTVGRGSDRDLVLDCVKCSRFHAEFRIEDGQLQVEDQGSTNGSYVNGRKAAGCISLEHDDLVQFGDARFRVVDLERELGGPDDEATVLASTGDLEGLLEDALPAAPDAGSSGGENGESAEAPASTSDADAPRDSTNRSKPDRPADRKPEPRQDADSSIPRSWADADQLEQASHTSMMASGELEALGESSPSLDPEIAIARAREHAGPDGALLVGLNESVMGVMFELSPGNKTDNKDAADRNKQKWEIGRGERADIAIDAESVSGRHCQVVHENGRWKVVNMMSANGTFVNDRKVLSAYLKPGDVIRIGSIELVFDSGGGKRRVGRRSGASSASEQRGIVRRLAAPFRWLGRLFTRNRR